MIDRGVFIFWLVWILLMIVAVIIHIFIIVGSVIIIMFGVFVLLKFWGWI